MTLAMPPEPSMLSRFLTWWGSELRGLLPARDRHLTAGPEPDWIVTPRKDGYELAATATRRGRKASAQGAAGDSRLYASRQDLLDALSDLARARRGVALGVRLEPSACFPRRVELPSAGATHLPRLLALDLERNSPFPADTIRTAHIVEGASPDGKKLIVRQIIAKREGLDDLVADIEERGIAVTRVDCWDDSGTHGLPIDLLREPEQTDTGTTRRSPMVLAMTTAALGAAAVWVAIDRHETALAALRDETAALQRKAEASKAALTRSESEAASHAGVWRTQRDYVSKAHVLEELTRLLPDTAWVQELRIEGAQVDLSGLAASASPLVRTLERSSTFVDASMTSPVTFDQVEGKERFSLRARLRQAQNETNGEPNSEAKGDAAAGAPAAVDTPPPTTGGRP